MSHFQPILHSLTFHRNYKQTRQHVVVGVRRALMFIAATCPEAHKFYQMFQLDCVISGRVCSCIPCRPIPVLSTSMPRPQGTSVKFCRVCGQLISDKKAFYNLFRNSFLQDQHHIIVDIIGPFSAGDCGHKHVCKFCYNKLNRLSRIDHELRSKQEQLTADRNTILKSLCTSHLQRFSPTSPTAKKHIFTFQKRL